MRTLMPSMLAPVPSSLTEPFGNVRTIPAFGHADRRRPVRAREAAGEAARRPRRSGGPGRAGRSGRSRCAGRARWAGRAGCSLRTGWSYGACRASGSRRALLATLAPRERRLIEPGVRARVALPAFLNDPKNAEHADASVDDPVRTDVT